MAKDSGAHNLMLPLEQPPASRPPQKLKLPKNDRVAASESKPTLEFSVFGERGRFAVQIVGKCRNKSVGNWAWISFLDGSE